MIFKNVSKLKLTLAFISIVITFFVWQQGLRDSLNRPSVSFDISQKEQEIAELSVQSIPVDLKKFFIINDPVDQINKSLSEACLLYTSPSPRDRVLSRMPSSA